MDVVQIPIDQIVPPEWNANIMELEDRLRLKESILRYDLIVPLVVRKIGDDAFETIGGAQRFAVLTELEYQTVLCVVVEAGDAEARLLAHELNHIHGEDDLGLRAESLRHILEIYSQQEVLALLPETTQSLQTLASLGQTDLSQHLQARQAAQAARLRHMTIRLLPTQVDVVEEALEHALAGATKDEANPNRRGNAMFHLCTEYLKSHEEMV